MIAIYRNPIFDKFNTHSSDKYRFVIEEQELVIHIDYTEDEIIKLFTDEPSNKVIQYMYILQHLKHRL